MVNDLVIQDHRDRRWKRKYEHIASYLEENELPFDISAFREANLLQVTETAEAQRRTSIKVRELRDILRRNTIALFKRWLLQRAERRFREHTLERRLRQLESNQT